MRNRKLRFTSDVAVAPGPLTLPISDATLASRRTEDMTHSSKGGPFDQRKSTHRAADHPGARRQEVKHGGGSDSRPGRRSFASEVRKDTTAA